MPNSNTPINKLKGYTNNLIKEAKTFGKSYQNVTDLQDKYRNYPPAQRPAIKAQLDAAAKKNRADQGQLAGALLQGRRYNEPQVGPLNKINRKKTK